MESIIKDLVIKYNYILSILRDSYKNKCSEISIKVSALNLSCTSRDIDLENFKTVIDESDHISDLESRLIALSLYKSMIKKENSEDDIFEILSKLPGNNSKGVYSLICSIIIYCSDKDTNHVIDSYNSLSKILGHNHPVTNAFEYSPFMLLSSMSEYSAEEIEKKARSIYYSLHDSAFARGTNTYCTTMYLSTIPYNADTDYIRKIYTSLKSLIPCNQFNYLDCAELYVHDNNFSDYRPIIEIYNEISNTGSPKWFSEQLDVSIAIGLYLYSLKSNILPKIIFNKDCEINSNLLTSMISSTLLLNSSI
jgi:hypothetical protein